MGCGNGVLLLALAEEGFQKLTGVDYSQKAIDLAREVLDNEKHLEVELLAYDIVDPAKTSDDFKFKLAHDKGTYDAISLNQDNPKEKRQKYIENVYNILLDDGYLILTSCNWTKDEVIEHFNDCKLSFIEKFFISFVQLFKQELCKHCSSLMILQYFSRKHKIKHHRSQK